MSDYLQTHPEIFVGVVGLIFVINLVTVYIRGRKAEQRFNPNVRQEVKFRERGASGYSNKSLLTKLGGASGALEVVVTDAELWIKGIWPPFSYIGTKFDLTHRILRSQIRTVHAGAEAIEIRFTNEAGGESHISLKLRAPQAFMAAIGG